MPSEDEPIEIEKNEYITYENDSNYGLLSKDDHCEVFTDVFGNNNTSSRNNLTSRSIYKVQQIRNNFETIECIEQRAVALYTDGTSSKNKQFVDINVANPSPKKVSTSYIDKIYPGGLWNSTKETMSLSFGLVLTQICIMGIQPMATMFAGHLGTLELDAVGLANTIINISGTSIAIGTSTACITVFSQTYGAKNYKYLGILLQKSIFILLLTLMPCYALHLNMEQILLYLGQDRQVAKLAAHYLITFMPGNFFQFMYIILRCYAQCQNVVYPLAVLCAMSTVVGVVSQYLLLYVYRYGIMLARRLAV